MIDDLGRWTPEKDYSVYPSEKWCDLDRVANYIVECGYSPVTSLENVTVMLTLHFEGETEDEASPYYPEYDDYGTYNLTGLKEYVEDIGGLKEFDYWA